MLILSCPFKLKMLEMMLRKNLPQTLMVCGAVMNINRGNPVGHEAIVDSWPEVKAVLTRPRREVASDDRDMYANLYAAFYHDLDVCQTLLLDTDAINWAHSFRIYGNGIAKVSQDIAVKKQVKLVQESFFVYLNHNPKEIPEKQLDPGLTVSSLNSSHADLLNETWPFGGNERSCRYFANILRCFPSTCLLDTKGQPLSWTIMEPLGAVAHGYTLAAHRGKGYSTAVMKTQAMKIQASGFPVYVLVAQNNVRAQKVLEYMGFERLSWTCDVCVHSSA